MQGEERRTMKRWLVMLSVVLAASLMVSACGRGSSSPEETPTPGVELTSTSIPRPPAGPIDTAVPPSPSAPIDAAPAATVPAARAAVPTGTQTGRQAAEAAFAVALRQFEGVSDADCQTNNPQKRPCVSAQSSPSTVQRGIAAFGVSDPEGFGGVVGVLGRDPAGEWRFWFAGQQAYQLLVLPGDMLICAEGDSLNVRSAPATDARIVGSLPDLAAVRAEAFVLTEPASGGQEPGYGWYHLSAPLDGWAYSKYLTNALLGDCALRDGIEARGPGQ
jgi:hypothetical protein